MTTYLGALAAVALLLAILIALAWAVQRRNGNSRWVDSARIFMVGLVGAGSSRWPVSGASPWRWPVAARKAQRSDSERCQAYQARTTLPAREDVVA